MSRTLVYLAAVVVLAQLLLPCSAAGSIPGRPGPAAPAVVAPPAGADLPAAAGELRVVVLVTDRAEVVEEPVPGRQGAAATGRALQSRPGQTVYLAFLVGGLARGAGGEVSYAVSFTITRPDGSVLFRQEDHAVWFGQMPAGQGLLPAGGALDFMLDASDPAGTYTVRAVLEDRTANTRAAGSAILEFTHY